MINSKKFNKKISIHTKYAGQTMVVLVNPCGEVNNIPTPRCHLNKSVIQASREMIFYVSVIFTVVFNRK